MQFRLFNTQMASNKKNLLLSIYLAVIYLLVSVFVLYDFARVFLLVPFFLIILVFKLVWDNTSYILSSLFAFLGIFLVAVFITSTFKTKAQQELQLLYNLYQFKNDLNNKVLLYKDIIENFTKTSESFNVFFVETNHEKTKFSTKQLCALESAAKNNPNAKVYVASIMSKINSSDLLLKYSNLYWLQFKPIDLFHETPLWDWWEKGSVFKSPHMMAHIADASRIALLYKYGGFYSDLDTITVRSFEGLLKYSGLGYLRESTPSVGNGFLCFRKKHPYLEYHMKSFMSSYDPYVWGANGPVLFMQTMKQFCQVENIFDSLMMHKKVKELDEIDKELATTTNDELKYTKTVTPASLYSTLDSDKDKCKDLFIFPETYFYPYSYIDQDLSRLFNSNSVVNIAKLIDTYSVHFYGKKSENIKVKINSNSLFEFFARFNCPVVYESVKKSNKKYFD